MYKKHEYETYPSFIIGHTYSTFTSRMTLDQEATATRFALRMDISTSTMKMHVRRPFSTLTMSWTNQKMKPTNYIL